MADPLFAHLDWVEGALGANPFGLALDIDGTISPIAPTPQAAGVTPACREWLARLVPRLAVVAIITGRTVEDARRMVGVPGLVYVGNHGLEWGDGAPAAHPSVAPFLPALRELVQAVRQELMLPGLVIEDKGTTFSLHYRTSPSPEQARQAIKVFLSTAPSSRDLRIFEGKMVVEVRPPVDADKGSALAELIERYRLRGASYLGDDRTDVAAFQALRGWRDAGNGLGVAIAVVGEETPPEVIETADLTLRGVEEVERFLAWLAQHAPLSPSPDR